MKKEKRFINAILSPKQYNRLKSESEATLQSMAGIIREALEKLFEERDDAKASNINVRINKEEH